MHHITSQQFGRPDGIRRHRALLLLLRRLRQLEESRYLAFSIQPALVRLIIRDDQLLRAWLLVRQAALLVLMVVVHLDAGFVVALHVGGIHKHRVVHPLLVLLAELVRHFFYRIIAAACLCS